MAALAIVILNWNGQEMLERFLPSILRNSDGADIYVADNGSTDGSVELLRTNFPDAKVIELGNNYGFAEGYNQALSRLRDYTYYLLLNSDVEVKSGWLTAMMNYMDEHPEVGACQPKLLCQWNPTHFEYAGAAGGYIDALGYPYCRGRIFNTVEKDEGQYDTVAEVHWASGAALLVRSVDFWSVGGLDGSFFAHQEEIDLCWRLWRNGKKVVCVPQSVVYHLGGGTLPKGNSRKTYLNFRNNIWLLRKNLPESDYRRVMRWRLLLDAVASLQMLLTGQFKSACAVWRARRDASGGYNQDQRLSALGNSITLRPKSLLWAYYIKRKKKYSDLYRQ